MHCRIPNSGESRVATYSQGFQLQEGKKCLHSLAKQVKLASSVLQRYDAASSLHVTGVDDDFAPFLSLKGVKDVPIHSHSIPDLLQPHEKQKV